MGKFGLKMGEIGLTMYKFGLRMCKIGLKMGKFGLKIHKIGLKMGKLGLKMYKFSLIFCIMHCSRSDSLGIDLLKIDSLLVLLEIWNKNRQNWTKTEQISTRKRLV